MAPRQRIRYLHRYYDANIRDFTEELHRTLEKYKAGTPTSEILCSIDSPAEVLRFRRILRKVSSFEKKTIEITAQLVRNFLNYCTHWTVERDEPQGRGVCLATPIGKDYFLEVCWFNIASSGFSGVGGSGKPIESCFARIRGVRRAGNRTSTFPFLSIRVQLENEDLPLTEPGLRYFSKHEQEKMQLETLALVRVLKEKYITSSNAPVS